MGKERELQRSELENRQRQARLEHEGQLERERYVHVRTCMCAMLCVYACTGYLKK